MTLKMQINGVKSRNITRNKLIKSIRSCHSGQKYKGSNKKKVIKCKLLKASKDKATKMIYNTADQTQNSKTIASNLNQRDKFK